MTFLTDFFPVLIIRAKRSSCRSIFYRDGENCACSGSVWTFFHFFFSLSFTSSITSFSHSATTFSLIFIHFSHSGHFKVRKNRSKLCDKQRLDSAKFKVRSISNVDGTKWHTITNSKREKSSLFRRSIQPGDHVELTAIHRCPTSKYRPVIMKLCWEFVSKWWWMTSNLNNWMIGSALESFKFPAVPRVTCSVAFSQTKLPTYLVDI